MRELFKKRMKMMSYRKTETRNEKPLAKLVGEGHLDFIVRHQEAVFFLFPTATFSEKMSTTAFKE